MLYEFIALNREEIILRCRAKVARRSDASPTDAELDYGLSVFLDQLVDALRLRLTTSSKMDKSALQHGHELQLQGFTVSQVVHDYGDICQAITELAVEMDAPISTDDFRILNRCLDDAIAGAVTQYTRERNQTAINGEAERGSERLGFFAHELRNLTHTAIMAFEILKTGNVGVTGSIGTVLNRSLVGLRALIDRSLAEVRLTQGVQNRQPFPIGGFVEEVVSAATLEANARGIHLTVEPVMDGVAVEADRQVLAAAVANLLQNAVKFTKPDTTVILRVEASDDRVRIEVEDECGGFPDSNGDQLFRPFEQRSADRTGLGLGLAFSRWAVEANRGCIETRNLPGKGCVFTVDVPRLQAAERLDAPAVTELMS